MTLHRDGFNAFKMLAKSDKEIRMLKDQDTDVKEKKKAPESLVT